MEGYESNYKGEEVVDMLKTADAALPHDFNADFNSDFAI